MDKILRHRANRSLRAAAFRQKQISMATHNNQVSVTYTDAELRNLVEEYITQQKTEFTLKGVCSYILYWAVEDSKVAEGKMLLESDELQKSDQERAMHILETITEDGRMGCVESANGELRYNKH